MTNIYRIQANNSIISESFCIAFIDFIFKDKSLLDYANLFSSSEYEKNDKITLKHLQLLKRFRWKKYIALFVVSIENVLHFWKYFNFFYH